MQLEKLRPQLAPPTPVFREFGIAGYVWLQRSQPFIPLGLTGQDGSPFPE